MESVYAFTAYNTETQYGYGTQQEAQRYCDFLNQGKEINLYEYEAIEMDEQEAETKCFNLADALLELA